MIGSPRCSAAAWVDEVDKICPSELGKIIPQTVLEAHPHHALTSSSSLASSPLQSLQQQMLRELRSDPRLHVELMPKNFVFFFFSLIRLIAIIPLRYALLSISRYSVDVAAIFIRQASRLGKKFSECLARPLLPRRPIAKGVDSQPQLICKISSVPYTQRNCHR